MQSIRKYPRTQHIEGSRLQPGDEDLDAAPFARIAGRHLVVEEKVDGANCGISFSPSGDLLLQSILYASERRIAVINGTRVREGDHIGSARVVRIKDSQVLLETSRGMRTLRLLPETLRR